MFIKSKMLMFAFILLLKADALAQRDSFQVESVIDASIQRVWQAFTDPADLTKWSVKLAEVDLRVSGLIRTSYDASAVLGDESTFETRILTFETNRMIAFQPVIVPKDLPSRDAYMKIWTIVYFDSLSKSQTRVRVSSHGYGPSESAQQMLASFEKGNKSKLQRLNEYLQTASAAVDTNPRIVKNPITDASQKNNVERIPPLIQTIEIDAPLPLVWDAFSTSKSMAEWMAPLATIDMRVGGKMMANYNPAGRLGDPETIVNTVICYDPLRMISLKVAKPPATFPFKDAIANTWSVMYFEKLSLSRTRIRIVGMGYDTSEQSQKMKQFFDVGNDWTLRELSKYLSSKPASQTAVEKQGAKDASSTSYEHGNVKVTITKSPKKRLDFEIEIPATREQVWHALTTVDGVREFYCPGGQIVLEPGGVYEYHFMPDAPPGKRGMEGTKLFTLLPMQMLAGTGSAPPMFPQVRKEKTRWVTIMDEVDNEHTRVRMSMVDWPASEEWSTAFEYFIKNNPVYFEMLYKRFTNGPIDWQARGVVVKPLPPVTKTTWPGRTLEKQVLLKASPKEVWNRWTTPDGLGSFFSKHTNIDFRIGGAYELYFDMNAPVGKRGGEGCEILTYAPYELLAFTWNAPPSIPRLRDANARTHVILQIKAQTDGYTQLTLSQIGIGDGEDWDAYYTYFDRAWSNVLKSLAASFDSAGEAE